MRNFYTLFITLGTLFSLLYADDSRIIKNSESNPTARLEWQGPTESKKRFQHVMLFADWFDFHRDAKSNPDYVIKAKAQKSGAQIQLQVQVLDGKISKLHKQFSGTDEMSLYHFAMDTS